MTIASNPWKFQPNPPKKWAMDIKTIFEATAVVAGAEPYEETRRHMRRPEAIWGDPEPNEDPGVEAAEERVGSAMASCHCPGHKSHPFSGPNSKISPPYCTTTSICRYRTHWLVKPAKMTLCIQSRIFKMYEYIVGRRFGLNCRYFRLTPFC